MKNGFLYLTAIIDVYSRYIVGWGISNTLDADASLSVLKQAIKDHGKPECANAAQATRLADDLFDDNLVMKVYFFEGIKSMTLSDDYDINKNQNCLLFALSKALLYQTILNKVDSYSDTFLIGLPVSVVDWNLVSVLLDKTKKV